MQEGPPDTPPPPLSPLVLWDTREDSKTGMACLPLFCVSADCSCQEAHLTAFEVDDRFQGIVRRGNQVELEFRDDGSGRPRPRTRGVMAVIDLSTGRATVDAEAPRRSQDPALFGRLQALLDEAAIADLKGRWERFKEERRRDAAAADEAWDKRDWTDWDGPDLYWQEVTAEATPDLYLLDGITYEALDHYCADTDCDCRECGVDFFPLADGARGDEIVGTVLVEATTREVVGTRNLPGRRGLLDRLWTAFSARHDPAFMAHRWSRIREIAPRLHELRSEQLRPEPIRRETRAGRNDPCPCGSGRKYKRCCL